MIDFTLDPKLFDFLSNRNKRSCFKWNPRDSKILNQYGF